MGRLIIDGSRVYELDEACLKKKKNQQRPQNTACGDKKPKKQN